MERMGEERESIEAWQEQDRQVHADCRVFTVERRRYFHPRRKLADDFFVVRPADWAVAMAQTAEGNWVMVKQFRYGLAAMTWEFPSGCVDPGEDTIAAARRELREESGFEGDDPILLGTVSPNPAIQDNRCSYVLFRQAVQVGSPQWDEHEEMEIAMMSDAELRRATGDGRVCHSLMLAGIFLYDRWRKGIATEGPRRSE